MIGHLIHQIKGTDIRLYEALTILDNRETGEGLVLSHEVTIPSGAGNVLISYSLITGSLLIVVVTQNQGGNGTISWSGSFAAGTPTTIAATAAGRTVFVFFGLTEWILVATRNLP